MGFTLKQQDALSVYRRTIADVFKDIKPTPSFLRSLTTEKSTSTLAVSIETERGLATVAKENVRGGSPNVHTWNKSKESMYIPPYYNDSAVINEFDAYQRVFGESGFVNNSDITDLAQRTVDKVQKIIKMQERAIEKQVAEVLSSGVLMTKTGKIDFGRLPESLVTNAPTDYWTVPSISITAQFQADINFIVQQGNSSSGRFNVILGSKPYEALTNNEALLKQADLRRINFIDLGMPTLQTNGATLLGVIAVGTYQVVLWGYTGVYDTGVVTNGVKEVKSFIPEDSYIMLPEDVDITQWFAGVPTLPNNKMIFGKKSITNGKFKIHEAMDTRAQTHEAIVKVAPLCVPRSIDRIVTRKVIENN